MEYAHDQFEVPIIKEPKDEPQRQIISPQSGSQQPHQANFKDYRRPTPYLSYPSSNFQKNRQKLRILIVAAGIIISFLLLFIGGWTANKNYKGSSHIQTRLPRILWIYTYSKWEGATAMDIIQLHYFNHTAVANGYEVRIVDSWTAYDWLSSGTVTSITTTIQNTTLDQTVCSLLTLALLAQHGGIMVRGLQFIFTRKNFEWLEKMFEKGRSSTMYVVDPNEAEVYLPTMPVFLSPNFHFYFDTAFIAAVPNSTLLLKAFQLLQRTITDHQLPLNGIFGFLRHNSGTGIDFLPESINSVMTSLVAEANKNYQLMDINHPFKIQSSRQWNYIDLSRKSREEGLAIIKSDNSSIFEGVDFVLGTYPRVREVVDEMLLRPPFEVREKNSLIYQLLSVPQNQKIFFKHSPKRQKQLCIIFVDDLNSEEQIQAAIEVFKMQTYLD